MRRMAAAAGGLVLALCGAGGLAVPTPAMAQAAAGDPALVQYRAYQTALETGVLQEARIAGVAAWEAARGNWPDTNPNKGALAYNAAWILTLANRSADAVEPAEAAVRLAREGGPYLVEEARLLAAHAALPAQADPANGRQIAAVADLAEPLERRDTADTIVGVVLGNLARRELALENFTSGWRLAGRAIASLQRSGDADGALAVDAYTTRAVSGIGRDLSTSRALEAYTDLSLAVRAWGDPGENPGEAWYRLLSWQAAVNGLAASAGARETEIRAIRDRTRTPWTRSNAADCGSGGLRRIEGPRIVYPPSALFRRRVGGAIVLIDAEADGTVRVVRVAGSVPRDEFGQTAARAIRNWRFEVPPGLPEACRTNYRVTVVYSLD